MPQTNQITSTPDHRGGRPRIAGRGITVADIALAYQGALGEHSVDWIVENFEVTAAEVHLALSYYFEHKDEIDQSIRDDEAELQELLRGYPSVRQAIGRKMAELRAKVEEAEK